MALGPFGLSLAKYNGHVFWDDDIWVFPALALTDPDLAKTIPSYRIAHLKGAGENYTAWLKGGKQVAAFSRVKDQSGQPGGAKFPWESSVTGRETIPGPSQWEDHVSGDVLWGLYQAQSLGLSEGESIRGALEGTAKFWRARLSSRKDGKQEIRNTISPDEGHAQTNDLYTNLLAKCTLEQADGRPHDDIVLPRDSKTFLTYDGDTVMGYQQAAAVLSIYPLQFPPAEKQALTMMERFPPKTILTGPAMSDSIHALIWARIGQEERAYPIWQKSWKDFTNHPLMLFSEKRVKEETYFTTGAAACLQTVVYGFLGYRIDSLKDPKAAWTKQLNAGRWLSVTPHLPQAWKSVKFKNFTVLGTQYTLTATHQGAQVTPGEK